MNWRREGSIPVIFAAYDRFREWSGGKLVPSTRGIVVACTYLAIVCTVADRGTAQCSTPNSKGPEPLKQLRYDEDYRYLQDGTRDSKLLDRIKYIPLNEDESAYLSFGGEIRQRYEVFRNRTWGADPPDDNGYLLQRYMVHSDLHIGSHVRFFFQMKSGLASGEVTVRPPDKDKLDVNQGFIDVTLFDRSNRRLVLRVGRREIAFGSSR